MIKYRDKERRLMSPATFTPHIGSEASKRLKRLARTTGRSRSSLAVEALNAYLDVNTNGRLQV